MRHLIIEEHTGKCEESRQSNEDYVKQESSDFMRMFYSQFNNCSPKTFLIFHDNDFHIITANGCMFKSYDNHYDNAVTIVRSLMGKATCRSLYDVSKSNSLNDNLKDMRIRGAELSKWMHEVNYIYEGFGVNTYAVCTRTTISEYLVNQSLMEQNYNEAKKYIKNKSNRIEHLLPQLEQLYRYNEVKVSNREVYLTVEHLRKNINKQIKQKS